MSISITRDIEIVTDAVEVDTVLSGDTVTTGDHCVQIESPESIISGKKKEYSIVGDAIYASVDTDDAPSWLTNLIDNIVDNKIAGGFTDYDLLVQDVRNAIDSIDIAKNNYVTQVNYDISQDGIINSVITQLDATYDLGGTRTTITNLDVAIANELQALGLTTSDIKTAYQNYTNGRITEINTSLSSAIGSATSSINALTAVYQDPVTGLAATANATSVLQTYVGIDSEGGLTDIGILADIAALTKQVDGIVDVYSGTHDVILNTDTATIDDDSIVLDEWPYALWLPMSGTVDPAVTTRTVNKDSVPTSFPIEPNTVYHNTSADTYWLFDASLGTWSSITLSEYTDSITLVREQHKGDSYVKYTEDINGLKTYAGSFKFILSTIDVTGPNYSTDSYGYTWAKVVDNDAQAALVAALNAQSLADGKVSVYFALYSISNPGTSDYIFYFDPSAVAGSKLKRTSDGSAVTPSEGDQATVKVVDGDAEDYYIYIFKDGIWVIATPGGIVAKSRWVIDLDAYLGGNDGNGNWGGESTLENTVVTKSNGEIKSAFEYNSALYKDGVYYETGFGLNSATTGGDGTEGNPFTSEFWVNAERFVIKDPNSTNTAVFNVTASGLQLALENTEATRNVVRGPWNSYTPYKVGDVVTSDGSSYSAIEPSTGIAVTNGVYWALLAQKGSTGPAGTRGEDGVGVRGASMLTAQYNINSNVRTLSSSFVDDLWDSAASPDYATPVIGDTIIVTNTFVGSNGGTHIYEYVGSGWSAANTFTINGNQVVTGTLSAAAIGTGQLTSTQFIGGAPAFEIDMNGEAVFRGITIRNANGDVLLSSSGGIDYDAIDNTPPPSDADNTLVTLAGLTANDFPLGLQNVNLTWNNLASQNGLLTSGNISTVIAGAAIQRALIAEAAIGQAQIGNLEVSTIKIADQAVTFPSTTTGGSTGVHTYAASSSSAKILVMASATARFDSFDSIFSDLVIEFRFNGVVEKTIVVAEAEGDEVQINRNYGSATYTFMVYPGTTDAQTYSVTAKTTGSLANRLDDWTITTLELKK